MYFENGRIVSSIKLRGIKSILTKLCLSKFLFSQAKYSECVYNFKSMSGCTSCTHIANKSNMITSSIYHNLSDTTSLPHTAANFGDGNKVAAQKYNWIFILNIFTVKNIIVVSKLRK